MQVHRNFYLRTSTGFETLRIFKLYFYLNDLYFLKYFVKKVKIWKCWLNRASEKLRKGNETAEGLSRQRENE